MSVIYDSDIELKRKKAILALWELSETWGKQGYELEDYCLDKCLRELQGLPEKQLGKPPYEWVE